MSKVDLVLAPLGRRRRFGMVSPGTLSPFARGDTT